MEQRDEHPRHGIAVRIRDASANGSGVNEAKDQVFARFPRPKRNELARFENAPRSMDSASQTCFGGAEIVLAGRKSFETKTAGIVRAPCRPGFWRALPGQCDDRLTNRRTARRLCDLSGDRAAARRLAECDTSQ